MPARTFRRRTILFSACCLLIWGAGSSPAAFNPSEWAAFPSRRPDHRHVSSRGIVQTMLEQVRPACAFQPGMAPEEFPAWREHVRTAMKKLMKFPEARETQPPRHVKTVARNGYRVEKWESFPFPNAAVPFLVLVPDAASPERPAPVVFCIPGSDQTKEELAAETSAGLESAPLPQPGPNAMACHYVREGWVAVVVDNAGTGEQGDAEHAAGRLSHDYDNLARFLLEMDWSWLGYTSCTDQDILDWVKKLPFIRKDRIILSGFSLGTEPMMVLGILNPDIYAFVYNDFLCRTLERAQTVTRPGANGSRPAPNSIRHLIPGFWKQFDFPDIVAALAPRPVFCTEGGLDRDFRLIARAYRLAGAEGSFRFLHQPRFADPAKRWQGERLPSGLDRAEFFRLANVDPRNHFFKKDAVIPWIKALLNTDQNAGQEKAP